MTRWVALAIVGVLVLAGCASPRGIVPDSPAERYGLPSWPRQSVSLEVVDARRKPDDSAALVEVTRAVLTDALAAASAPPGPARQLIVQITVHDTVLNGPVWIATTRFEATLMEAGRAVYRWDARAEQRRMNLLPSDARTASQLAYQQALTILVSRLEQTPP